MMLMQGNICDSKEAFKIFGVDNPITFSPENLDYLSRFVNLSIISPNIILNI